MIGTIRRHQKWLWGVIIAATISTFVVYLNPSTKYGGGGGSSGSAPAVDLGLISGEPVTLEQFQAAEREARIRFYLGTGTWPNSEEQKKQLVMLAQQSLLLQALMKEYK